jgi:hypothetical protein
MPWYKSGTVSVALNSNAVIGTGTAFLSNGRVGDAFRGPDGAWYEVTNIASDTAMSISPVYKGVTNAAGSYALAPMQGYVKDSADALRALVNTYGAKLAALGTTGNYDILPVSKGGTGRNTLGTSVAYDATTSANDVTPGRTMLVGSYGLGIPVVLSQPDLNTIITGKEYYVLNATNSPSAAGNGWLSVLPINLTYCQQRFVNQDTGGVSERTLIGGVWTNWTGRAKQGANSDITSLTGLTTALSVTQGGTGRGTVAGFLGDLVVNGAYWKGNVLGVVGQSGGIPTGAIIERNSNAGGEWVKFADGTLICWSGGATITTGVIAANNVGTVVTLTLPIAFANAQFNIMATAGPNGSNDHYGVTNAIPNGTNAMNIVIRNGVTAQTFNIRFMVVGRWF